MKFLNLLSINGMTVEQKELKVPAWVISVLTPILLAVIGYTIGLTSINAKASAEVSILKEDVVRIEADKAEESVVNMVHQSLIRIEGKLDAHIQQSKQD